jgi:TM2 domain-containing membrane protein YozV
MRHGPRGQILCGECITAWQSVRQPFAAPPPSGPNPSAAAVLGLIPGVGAMYNGQFFKGLIHVVVFAVLISITDHYNIFGIFIGAWVLYQSFEAYHTARAIRDGQPLPDPLGLNEVGNWLNLGSKARGSWQPGTGPVNPGSAASGPAGQSSTGPAPGGFPPPYGGQYQAPWQQTPYRQGSNPPPAAGFVNPPVPPVPPAPPFCWPRHEPIGAIVLIALGSLFLLGQLDFFNGRLFDFAWPLALIGLGVWLIVNRIGDSQGGSK